MFEQLVAALPENLKVRVLRYPKDQVLGYAALIHRVSGEIEPGPAVLLGESFSGPIAIGVAQQHPETIVGVVLAATFSKSPLASWLLESAARVDFRNVPPRLLATVLMGRYWDRALYTTLKDIIDESDPRVIATRLCEVAHVDADPQLARLSCPILALHGKSDWLIRKTHLWAELEHHPKATKKVLEGPHMLLQVSAEAAAREIASFMNHLDPNQ